VLCEARGARPGATQHPLAADHVDVRYLARAALQHQDRREDPLAGPMTVTAAGTRQLAVQQTVEAEVEPGGNDQTVVRGSVFRW
jgi:hypothetical protein